jgi:uncharacterized protein YfaP (DUF2135 family)
MNNQYKRHHKAHGRKPEILSTNQEMRFRMRKKKIQFAETKEAWIWQTPHRVHVVMTWDQRETLVIV